MTKLGVLKSLLNLKWNREKQTQDHIENEKTKFSRLAAMNEAVSESMQLAILASSMSMLSKYALTPLPINTMIDTEESCN